MESEKKQAETYDIVFELADELPKEDNYQEYRIIEGHRFGIRLSRKFYSGNQKLRKKVLNEFAYDIRQEYLRDPSSNPFIRATIIEGWFTRLIDNISNRLEGIAKSK